MTDFPHQHTAHCESGVMSTLLRRHGCDIDEALAFGLAAALTFVYLPLVKIGGMPLVSYRMPPKSIIRRCSKALGLRLKMQTFRRPEAGMAALDAALAAGETVGLQTSVFWLPYFPPEMRFHFNAHNLLVYGRDGGDYLISDPVFETVQRCPAADLQKARFAQGVLAPKGLMYTLDGAAADCDKLPQAVRRAIRRNAKQMLAPLFFVGVRGIRTLADKIEALPRHPQGGRYAKLYLGHIVRMQEEIGTGGAGFRYLYAYFLEQAATICAEPAFQAASQQLTAVGDEWRAFAGACVQQCRHPAEHGCAGLAERLRRIADGEETVWRSLKEAAA